MDISIVKTLPNDVVKALCNTLLHSLWQGVILAAVAGLIVVFTRKATSAMRYNLLVAALCFFAGGMVYTFASQLHIAQSNADKTFTYNLTVGQIQAIDITTPVNTHSSFTDSLIGYLNTHANIIVLIWFLVVCARSIQLLTGLNGLYHLRRRHIFEIDSHWQERVYELSGKLGIKRMVSVAESGMAKVPMVIGHLKPLILIPVGLVTALTPAQVDAILVHELAHIRRRDYLVNLLQSFMEIVFFFNPAVLWISTLIKTERENCCDDIAIAQTCNKAGYIRALVSCQEYQLSAPAYAMALSGKKNTLLGRVTRMVSNNNQSLNLLEKSLLAICLLASGLITTAFSNADKLDKLVAATTKAVVHATSAIKKEIAPDKIDVLTPRQITALNPATGEIKPENVVKADSPVVNNQVKQDSLKVDKVNDAVKKAVKREVERANGMSRIANNQPALAALPALSADPASPSPQAYVTAKANYDTKAATYSSNNKNYTTSPAKYTPYKSTRDDSLRAKITDEMMKDGIIKTKDNLSFMLSTSDFIVNGKTQDDKIYKKYRAEYVKATGNDVWRWYYNYDTSAKKQTETKSTTSTSSSTSH